MVMLGAAARAAELRAAQKAQARQASREAEEQRLPPPAAPVSLDAFSRPVASRNKGTKAYIPLVLGRTPEADHSVAAGDPTETPTKKAPTPSSNPSSSRLGSSNAAPTTRFSQAGTDPPTAPRAMVTREPLQPQPQPPAPAFPPPRPQTMPAAFHTTPPHPHLAYQQSHMFAGQYHYHTPPSHHMLPPPSNYLWPQQIPIHDPGFQFHQPPSANHLYPHQQLHAFDHSRIHQVDQFAPSADNHQPRRPIEIREPPQEHPQPLPQDYPCLKTPETKVRRFVFGPDDLSPTKQELKMSVRGTTPALSSATHQRQREPIRMRDPLVPRTEATPTEQENRPLDMPAYTHPGWLAKQSESEDSFSITSSVEMQFANPLRQYADISSTSEEPVTAVPWMRPGNIPEAILATQDDGHYDRATKMQKFVAVQQSLSKQGKTVLNNPERNNTASLISQVPSVMMDSISGPGPAVLEEQARYLPPVNQRPERIPIQAPPGLKMPDRPFVSLLLDEKAMLESRAKADDALRKDFGVGTDAWFDLKPPTLSDRKRMQSAMKSVRLKEANRAPPTVHEQHRWYTEDNAKKLMDEDPRPFLRAREHIDYMARDHSTRLHATVGEPQPPNSDVDMHAGMIRGAGHILINLTENLINDKKQDYFYRTKKAPDYAVDRTALVSGAENISLFEDKPSEKYNPPNRLARDPRYSNTGGESPREEKSGGNGLHKTKYGWGH
ncbi:uncharacterized protein HMPREF1541_04342 [Cyphellophora europaea CBS 101466]|uniref:Uncharacterized protein n=1 Tax=Cyphellophora europaea (strain CBS 101466) TaxID=1220924 RepID=W2RUE7_CYPE1|nr:uncharacterized protein HMPREF1541_04342 [Cyphellophora europaea CBS 101466]ETN40067.1 hypothetical protein HMPREF1541_04342 [Cyphellophora europaea CBS 101466]